MICEHQQLKRNCPICERDEEITRLKCVIAESKDRRSKNGTIARLEERYDQLWKDFSRISKALTLCDMWTPGKGGTVADAAERAAVEIARLRAEVAHLTLKPNERVIDVERIRELVKFQEIEKDILDRVGRENTLRLIWKELGIE